jgi:hypothetical protein
MVMARNISCSYGVHDFEFTRTGPTFSVHIHTCKHCGAAYVRPGGVACAACRPREAGEANASEPLLIALAQAWQAGYEAALEEPGGSDGYDDSKNPFRD